MIKHKIYFDEAGNTGSNLLDQVQPVYCLASTCFTEEQIERLLDKIQTNAKELHFKKLKKYRSSQLQILDVLNDEQLSVETVKYSVSDKTYSLFAHLIDRLVEPVLYDMGHDGYSSGVNCYFANFLYFLAKAEWTPEFFSRFTNAFQNMMRIQSKESIEFFFEMVTQLLEDAKEERDIYKLILRSREQINEILNHVGKYDLDLSMSAFSILVDQWGKKINERFEVIHDDSKQIAYWMEHINFYSSPKIKQREVGFKNETMRYPFQIAKLSMVESQNSKQIQLTDILVSAIAYAVTEQVFHNKKSKFNEEIMQSRLLNLDCHSIWPTINPRQLSLNGREGDNILDYLADLAIEMPEEFNKVIESKKKKRN